MRSLAGLDFDNSFARLNPAFYQVVDPTPLSDPYLVAFNPDAAGLIDLDPAAARDPDAARYLSGGLRLPGAEPVAALYAGHQFGVWVPQLGDGRAILLGEARNSRGERWDLQLKGSGQTKFSRMGDGRAVLRSTIREYLACEAMFALGIPTTRALAIVGSPDPVYRETVETAATVIRMAPTHVRFGSFQVLAARGLTERIAELADYVISHHHPELAGLPDRYQRWLAIVVERTADLMAAWMAVGFAHGVMNTDNMSVLGLTLDYGPYGFLEETDPGFICNHTDHDGRYAFGQQPAVGLWNVARFAESLLDLIPIDDANAALTQYAGAYEAGYGRRMREKLGLTTEQPGDPTLIGDMLSLMAANRVDYPGWFRGLTDPASLRSVVPNHERFDVWIAHYNERLSAEPQDPSVRRAAMNRTNPAYVLRNHLAQRAIGQAERGDFSEIDQLHEVLRRPFDQRPEHARYAEPAPPDERGIVVSCSS